MNAFISPGGDDPRDWLFGGAGFDELYGNKANPGEHDRMFKGLLLGGGDRHWDNNPSFPKLADTNTAAQIISTIGTVPCP
jgi:hypothetical protein